MSPNAAQAPQAPAAAAAANPQLDLYKRNVGMEVDAMGENIQKMNDMVFSFAEPGFQEFETSKYLVGILKQNGFTVQEGVAGIPTAFVARWGSGKPVIALGSDIDDIPQASQKPGVAWHEPIVEGAPGHGEGHNGGMPLQIAAALAVKKVMEQQHLQGTLMLWPGVAEELDGSKAYYVRDGLFKDVDISIFAHVADNLDVSWGDNANQTGLVSVQYNFTGESAHAAAAPWRGKSALDAVELMDIGWNFRREHLRLQQRSHYVIPNGGDQPNVVPPNASVWYYFREVSYPEIKRMWEIGDKMAQAATMMTDTDGHQHRARLGVARPLQQDDRRSDARQHREGRPAAMVRGRSGAGARAAARAEGAGGRAGDEAPAVPRPRGDPGRGEARRRLRRHRRHFVERADGDAAVSVQHGGRSRPQLGERDFDGDADRAQGHPGRRQGGGADRHRLPDEARADDAGVGLLPQRADQDHEVRPADPADRQARHLAEQGADGEVPAGDEEVLLRPDQVQELPRSARHQVSDDGKAGRIKKGIRKN